MREVHISDVHFPYHDRRAWELTLAIVRFAQPDLVYWNGDIMDCYPVSHFLRDPRRLLNIQTELDIAYKEMQRVREAAPNAQWKFYPGNHELRVLKYTITKAPELAFLRDAQIASLMRLDQMECEVLGRDRVHKINGLYHLHGDEYMGGSVNPARNIWGKVNESVILGHYHRAMVHYQRTLADHNHEVIINPCLCDMNPDYTKKPNWQQGLTIIDYADRGFVATPIVYFRRKGDYAAIVDGKLLTAKTIRDLR